MSRQERIYSILNTFYAPEMLTVENESNRHHVPAGSETHFKVVIVSSHFIELSRIKRHRHVNSLLAQEFQSGLHALSLHLYTGEEWANQSSTPHSPACRGGQKSETPPFPH